MPLLARLSHKQDKYAYCKARSHENSSLHAHMWDLTYVSTYLDRLKVITTFKFSFSEVLLENEAENSVCSKRTRRLLNIPVFGPKQIALHSAMPALILLPTVLTLQKL